MILCDLCTSSCYVSAEPTCDLLAALFLVCALFGQRFGRQGKGKFHLVEYLKTLLNAIGEDQGLVSK